LWIVVAFITLGVIYISGRSFYSSAIGAFKHHSGDMDTLIALGSFVAFVYSLAVLIFPNMFDAEARNYYFGASVLILGFIDIGHAFEIKAQGKASSAIEKLLGLRSKTAIVQTENGFVEKNIDNVKVGDIVEVPAGSKIPLDGILLEAKAIVNESMLTGESHEVSKNINDEVFAGTINTGSNNIIYKVTRLLDDTKLSQIIKLVNRARNTKPKIGSIADKIAGIFVPTIIIISIVTAILWYNLGPKPVFNHALVAFAAVLIVSCPCALGLAAPLSTIIGIEKASELGGIIKNGKALQEASKINLMVLDKTGTLTKGTPVVSYFKSFNLDSDQDEFLNIIYNIESRSSHPLAKAIASYIKSTNDKSKLLMGVKLSNIAGRGIQATYKARNFKIGNAAFLELSDNDINMVLGQAKENSLSKNASLVWVSEDGVLKALFALEDEIQEGALEFIKQLKDMNIKPVMLTGDNKTSAYYVAKKLGIDEFFAELMPEDKLHHVKSYQTAGYTVGMLGDGINDSPSLAQANVGFGISTGSDVAIENSDISITRNSLLAVTDMISLSIATIKNIKLNLFWALVYNAIAIPLAAGGFYLLFGHLISPSISAAAMAASDIVIVLNANRLNLFKVKRG
ncbi:MAG: heavy metal translocating P-type ATPase, partial [Psittacicella sp.]